jgi:hypothetical protein
MSKQQPSREQIVGNALDQLVVRAKLLDRLLAAVPGPECKGYKLSEILKIAEDWQSIK